MIDNLIKVNRQKMTARRTKFRDSSDSRRNGVGKAGQGLLAL